MFRCEYCGQTYVREAPFLKHTCEAMDRARIFDTPVGQSAFMIYQQWWKMRRRIPPGADKFKESTQFRAMVDFAKFTKRTKLNLEVYLTTVVNHDLSPEHWMRDDVYVKYLEYIDRTMTADEQIKLCVDYIMKLTDALECDTSELFDNLEAMEVMQLIRDRKLSPWILLHSGGFKTWLVRQEQDVQLRLQELIRPVYWKFRFGKEPASVTNAKKIAKALGI